MKKAKADRYSKKYKALVKACSNRSLSIEPDELKLLRGEGDFSKTQWYRNSAILKAMIDNHPSNLLIKNALPEYHKIVESIPSHYAKHSKICTYYSGLPLSEKKGTKLEVICGDSSIKVWKSKRIYRGGTLKKLKGRKATTKHLSRKKHTEKTKWKFHGGIEFFSYNYKLGRTEWNRNRAILALCPSTCSSRQIIRGGFLWHSFRDMPGRYSNHYYSHRYLPLGDDVDDHSCRRCKAIMCSQHYNLRKGFCCTCYTHLLDIKIKRVTLFMIGRFASTIQKSYRSHYIKKYMVQEIFEYKYSNRKFSLIEDKVNSYL